MKKKVKPSGLSISFPTGKVGNSFLSTKSPSFLGGSGGIYTWVERRTVKVQCLAQDHNTMSPTQCPRLGLKTGPLAPESSALTTRPLCLPKIEK